MDNRTQKTKQFSFRMTEQEYQELNHLAQENNVTLTTYILNQCLSGNNSIYTKTFYDTIMKLNALIISVASTPEENTAPINDLIREVNTLWQYLK